MKEEFKNITFVCPDPSSFVSGGNVYNLHFIKALSQFDPAIKRINFEAYLKLSASERSDLYFIDSIYFEDLKKYVGDLSKAFFICHHLESLNQSKADRVTFFMENEKATLDRFGGFLSTSPFTQAYLLSFGYTDKWQLEILPAVTFDPVLKKKHTDRIDAVMVNNLMQRKGIVELLETIKNAKLSPDQFQLTIIGSPKLEPDYAARCQVLFDQPALSGIINYVGPLPPEKVRAYFEKSNLYISAAFMETFGIALQEAVAYRMPILAIDGGSTDYHIEEFENGFLFDRHQDLVETLKMLCTQQDEFESLVRHAWDFRKFENYTWEEAAKHFVQQLNFCLD